MIRVISLYALALQLDDDDDSHEIRRLIRQAQESFGSNSVVAAYDFFTLRVPKREPDASVGL